MATQILYEFGFQVITAADGQECVRFLKNVSVILVSGFLQKPYFVSSFMDELKSVLENTV